MNENRLKCATHTSARAPFLSLSLEFEFHQSISSTMVGMAAERFRIHHPIYSQWICEAEIFINFGSINKAVKLRLNDSNVNWMESHKVMLVAIPFEMLFFSFCLTKLKWWTIEPEYVRKLVLLFVYIHCIDDTLAALANFYDMLDGARFRHTNTLISDYCSWEFSGMGWERNKNKKIDALVTQTNIGRPTLRTRSGNAYI